MLCALVLAVRAFDPRADKDWRGVIAHAAAPRFVRAFSTDSFVMRANGSVLSEFRCAPPLGNAVYNFDIGESGGVTVLDAALREIAQVALGERGGAAEVRGRAGEYDVVGFLSADRRWASQVLIAERNGGDVYVMNGMEPPGAKEEIVKRAAPALCLLVLMVVGRAVQRRFWKQYARMNTRTLLRREKEAEQER